MFTSIAIIGRPNVGKSTLFNKLTRSRKAIVSDFSGLTKDRNYGYITFGDQKTLLIDTGGIAQDESILKEDIAEQAWIAAEESSLIIFLLDGSENLNKEDLDILTSLRKLNKKFITNHACVYDKSNKASMNVFRVMDTVTVDACGNEETKKYSEMTADDYRNMDVWQNNQEYTYNKRNRYNNAIPMWQKSMNIRHYEKESDGLHTSNSDRASLDSQLRGYNMNNQIKGSEFYKNYYYDK